MSCMDPFGIWTDGMTARATGVTYHLGPPGMGGTSPGGAMATGQPGGMHQTLP